MDIGEIAGDISGAVGADPKKLLGSIGGLIDQLTPNGSVPTSGVGSIVTGLEGMLGGKS